ncbi:hypothetical protein J1605_021237 [Eschrichtius robustus]|uniref:Uncharacterized protein n=1 Tax=Eschrichtius robustus TaxID=9764 RepID=A0AB34HGQ8_ESCRO|nr:hypothetical protein J1605_021237 [Eschrichtius robustus]
MLVLEAQEPNVERYTKVAAAAQNAIQCYRVIYDEKKRATTQTSLDRFFKRVDRIEASKEPEPVPSTSGMSDIAACPPSPIADNPSALPSPTSSNQQLFLPVSSMPAPVCQLSYCTIVLYKEQQQTAAPPGNLLEVQNLEPHPRHPDDKFHRTRCSRPESINKKDEQKDGKGLVSALKETQMSLIYDGIKVQKGASLVAQWLRICLSMQGTRVRALVWEDPTCRGATKSVRHNY